MGLAEDRELMTTERVALVVSQLNEGAALSNRAVADLTGITIDGARKMMLRISRVLPIVCDDGNWVKMS